jgi:hypothetical protein
MIDIDAPIVPGKSAAGLSIGGLVSELLVTVRPRSTTTLSSGERHDLGAIRVWAKEGVITQIGVYSGCWGVLQPGIRIGSTIADVEDSFGSSVQEDEEDNLVVPDSPGWCFETEEWGMPQTISNNRNARIVSIFVFSPRMPQSAVWGCSEAADRTPNWSCVTAAMSAFYKRWVP